MRGKQRWAAAGAVVVALIAALAVFTGPVGVPGTAVPVDADELSGVALDEFGKISELRLTGEVRTAVGATLTTDVAVLSGGRVTATVSDGAGGAAEFAVLGGTTAVRANRAWWLNTMPVAAEAHTDRWVRADDGVGFPVALLTSLSGAGIRELIRARTDGHRWRATADELPDGTPVHALTTDDGAWTVHVSLDDEPRLLGFEGPLTEALRKFAGTRGTAYPGVRFTTSAPDDGCRTDAERRLAEATPEVRAAPPPPQPPTPADDPVVGVQIASTGLCTTPTCPTPVTVANAGQAGVTGMLVVSSSSGGGGVFPVQLGPGGSATNTAVVVNPAGTCRQTCTIPYTVTAFVQVTALAGGDLDAGRRLHERGVDPNDPVPGNRRARGPDVVGLVDGMTSAAPPLPAGFRRQDTGDVVDLVQETVGVALEGRVLSSVRVLGEHPALVRPANPAEHPLIGLVEEVLKGDDEDVRSAARQTLLLLQRLAEENGRQPGTVALTNGALLDSQHGRAYSVAALGPDERSKAERAANPAHPLGRVEERVLNGLTTARGRLPAGYSHVLVLHVDPQTPEIRHLSRRGVIDHLMKTEAGGTPLRKPVLDPPVSEFVVVNGRSRVLADPRFPGAHVYGQEDIEALTRTFDPNTPPNGPPQPGSLVLTPANERHILTGDPYDPTEPEAVQDDGGHLAGAGVPGKTEFPSAWAADDVKQVVRQLITTTEPEPTPVRGGNHMGVTQWQWVYVGAVTHEGITVELTVRVLDDGRIRTAHPTENDVVNNMGDPWDPTAVHRNPHPVPPRPVLTDSAGRTAPLRPTDRPRWVRPAEPGRRGHWLHPGTDKAGNQVVVRTDETGGFDPATDVLDVHGNPAPVARC